MHQITDYFLKCDFSNSELLSYVDQSVDQATVDGSGHDLILWLNLLGESESRPQASVCEFVRGTVVISVHLTSGKQRSMPFAKRAHCINYRDRSRKCRWRSR